MSDSIKVEEKPKLDDITMEDATTTAAEVKTEQTESKPTATLSAVEEFAPQKHADGELIIKDLPDSLKGKSKEEVAEVKKSIVEQVEFYFSDSNFPYDKFLYTLSLRDPLGFIDLSVLLSFKRMKSAYTQPYGAEFITDCMKEREVYMSQEGRGGSLCVIGEGGKQIRRRRGLVKDSTAWDRTVYVKGFGTGETAHNSQEQLEAWFKPYGKINALRMRREDPRKDRFAGSSVGKKEEGVKKEEEAVKKEEQTGEAGEIKEESKEETKDVKMDVEAPKKESTTTGASGSASHSHSFARLGLGEFKGSVFVEFHLLEDAKKFVELDPKPKFQGEDVVVMFKEEYVVMKAKEKGIDPSTIQRNTGAGGGQAPKNKFNAFHLKNGGVVPEKGGREKRKRDDDDEGEKGDVKKEKKPVFLYIEYLGKKLAVDRAAGTLANADDLDYPKQTVLKFSNLPEDGDWKELKTSLVDGGFAETFMSYPKGAPAGSLCMKSNEPITDDEVEKIKGLGLALGDKTVDWRRATDEEEKAFWLTRANFQAGQAVRKADAEDAERKEREEENAAKDGRRGGRGGRGGRGRGGSRGRGGRGRGGRGGKRD